MDGLFNGVNGYNVINVCNGVNVVALEKSPLKALD
jgi:hypothetical protein